ncbi:hypothetical protein OOJ09_02705 [Mesorhizobium qingshengii]|uniref:Uncharacterized protein n=1 Tax=Mesorhizobium qingshengii TaxID=1165689 RepID=A0ABT4QNE8_9HYPH|nr:hypothetical protein [Mesorhizobium qingshengii]MCZ8543077.1 hypothetical protein [Mesorhizobium qingshengii]
MSIIRIAALFIAVTFVSLSQVTPSFSDACDPNKILRQDVTSYQSNLLVFLSYVNSVLQTNDQNDNNNGALSYGDLKLSFAEAKAMNEFLQTHEDFHLSKEESTSVLRSTLSEASVQAYIACLGVGGVAITVPDAAISDKLFKFRVYWNPKGGVAHGNSYKLKVSVTSGKLVNDDGGTTLNDSEDIEINGSVPFTAVRDNLDEQMYISAAVGRETDLVSIPARPQFLLKSKLVFTAPKPDTLLRSDHYGLVAIDRDECVAAEPDTILLPSTVKFVGQFYGADARAVPNPAKSDSSSACGLFHAHSACRTHDCDAGIVGYFSVNELYVEPIHR